ncbi:MAG: hypothetical protein H0W99_02780 [Acidobacteria bacterium]|nr:hypothetical protein [Acidobacteriota bacterium]
MDFIVNMSPTQAHRQLLCYLSLLLALSGCERPAQPPQQYTELHQINQEHRKLIPQVVDDLPVRFSEIMISVVGPNNSTLGARADWELTEGLEKLQAYLKKRVALVRSDLTDGGATGVTLRCNYLDQSGKPSGTDAINIKLNQSRKENITFQNLGVSGAVFRVEVGLDSVIWESQGQEINVLVK